MLSTGFALVATFFGITFLMILLAWVVHGLIAAFEWILRIAWPALRPLNSVTAGGAAIVGCMFLAGFMFGLAIHVSAPPAMAHKSGIYTSLQNLDVFACDR